MKTVTPWGEFTTFYRTNNYAFKLLQIKPGFSLSLQYHKMRNEVWYIDAGVGEMTLGDNLFFIQKGVNLYIPKEMIHSVKNTGSEILKIAEFQYGDLVSEHDIVRIKDPYEGQR